MNTGVSSNAREVSDFMKQVFSDQAPFALQQGVRTTTLQAQEAQRKHQREVFTIRNPYFMDRGVKISQWPRKQDPTAIIRIHPPGGEKRVDIITRHEEDSERTPERSKALVVPAKHGSERGVIRRSNKLHPSKWKLRRVDGGSSSTQVYRGRNGIYLIRHPDGSGVVRQRTGPGRHGSHQGSVPIFFLRRRTPLDPQLDFVANVTRIVEERWEDNIAEAWDRALRTAR